MKLPLKVDVKLPEWLHNSLGTLHLHLSQLPKPLWTDPGLKSGNDWRVQDNLHLKEIFFHAQAGNDLLNLPLKSSHAREKPLHHNGQKWRK